MGIKKSVAEPPLSLQSMRLLNAFLAAPSRELSGADLIPGAGIPSGTLYPLLYRFEEAGWLSGRWEKGDPKDKGRPLRKLYRLTGHGLARATQIRGKFIGGLAAT